MFILILQKKKKKFVFITLIEQNFLSYHSIIYGMAGRIYKHGQTLIWMLVQFAQALISLIG